MSENKIIKNVLSIGDFTNEQLFDFILPLCRKEVEFAAKGEPRSSRADGRKVHLLFLEPSTRTRSSYFEAVQLQGLRYDQTIGAEATSLVKKESLANTARMLARYNANVIVARTKIEGAQRFMSWLLEKEGYRCAVHNGGDGTNQHPTQTVLDLLTIDSFLGRFDNFTIGFFGDLRYGRTVHSLLNALSFRKEIRVVLVQTQETALQEKYLRMFPGIRISENMEDLEICDIIYGSRLQEERFEIDPLVLDRLREKFTVTANLLKILKKNVIIMHPMPYVQEFPPNVRNDPMIVIDKQAQLGVPSRMALLELSLANLDWTAFPEEDSSVVLSIAEDCSIQQYHDSRESRKKVPQFYMPIDNGTVIDHIPPGIGPKVKNFLLKNGQLSNEGPIHLIERIHGGGRQEEKEVLILRGNFVGDELKEAIISLSPSITFNEIGDGRFKKIKGVAPAMVRGFGKCPNSACITNHDSEAETRFLHTQSGLKCWFCENEFYRERVI